MIDLRSDTVTKPTEEMRKIMAEALVGDDVYGEDDSINNLQDYVADLLKKESAIFLPSGTMANQIAVALHTNAGDEVIIDSDAHIFYYETAAPAFISRVQMRTIKSERGEIPIEQIEEAIRPDIYYFPKTSLICLENTHNRHGGTVLSLDYISKVSKLADKNNLKFHCDGARLWNACIASNLKPSDYSAFFDTVSVCLSKGLGAPVGSVLCGNKEIISRALKLRKILGGGMRQAGIIASAGLYALQNHFKLLADDHKNAKLFGDELLKNGSININTELIETNMAMFDIPSVLDINEFVFKCKSSGLLLSNIGKNRIRVVFHFQISTQMALSAVNIINEVIKSMTNGL